MKGLSLISFGLGVLVTLILLGVISISFVMNDVVPLEEQRTEITEDMKSHYMNVSKECLDDGFEIVDIISDGNIRCLGKKNEPIRYYQWDGEKYDRI